MSLAVLLSVSVMGESNTSSAPGQANVGGFFYGGLAPSELDAIGELPFASAVGLGPRVLRAETATLAVLACLQALAGDWRGHRTDPT